MMIFFYFITIIILFSSFYYIDKIFHFGNKIENTQFPQIDGLRAILALSVVFHHTLIAYYYFLNGSWEVPESNFYALLGPISVSLFFMITGFLFGFKLFKNEFNIKLFFISRVRRLVPLYLFSVLLLVIIVFYLNDFQLKEDILSLSENILRWASFKFLHFTPINQDSRVFEIQSVYWTLKWEWKFYLVLPLLFLFRKRFFQDKNILFITILLIIFFFYKYIFVFIFFLGTLASVIYIEKVKIPKFFLNVLGIGSLILILIFYNTTYLKVPAILTAILFFSIVLTDNLKYLFNLNILRYFGTISYSIYLIHNIVVFMFFYLYDKYLESIKSMTSLEYFIVSILIVYTTSLLSMITHKHIEHRFYKRKF